MTPQSDLEITGNLFTHPFAELVAELADARVSGSLRVEGDQRKCIIYLKLGRVVFAVSNALTARLFQIMLDRNRLTKAEVSKIPNFASDIEFAAYLEGNGILSKAECNSLISDQIESIIVDLLAWKDGNWSFSSLKRIRDGLAFPVDTRRILFEYGRSVTGDNVLGRFRSLDERFHRSEADATGLSLDQNEGFVLSRVDEVPLKVADVVSISAMSDPEAMRVIYTLWLAGLIIRDDWQPAFSGEMVSAMKGAKLLLKQEAKYLSIHSQEPEPVKSKVVEPEQKEPEAVLSLDEYLARVEGADTYYDVLGVDTKADVADVKRAYFSLAKAFHPDKFHTEEATLLTRVQHAFTEMMRAHETLKNKESRDLYDYRIRKELAEREKREAEGISGDQAGLQAEQASQHFERGFTMLMEGDVEDSLPFLARAVHFAPKNARYHAYYGKALSHDETKRHKAEGEMQMALKLDPNNPTFRLLLVEFFIQFNLLKRAEGELNRLLAVFPSNREAQDLLASLKPKA